MHAHRVRPQKVRPGTSRDHQGIEKKWHVSTRNRQPSNKLANHRTISSTIEQTRQPPNKLIKHRTNACVCVGACVRLGVTSTSRRAGGNPYNLRVWWRRSYSGHQGERVPSKVNHVVLLTRVSTTLPSVPQKHGHGLVLHIRPFPTHFRPAAMPPNCATGYARP